MCSHKHLLLFFSTIPTYSVCRAQNIVVKKRCRVDCIGKVSSMTNPVVGFRGEMTLAQMGFLLGESGPYRFSLICCDVPPTMQC